MDHHSGRDLVWAISISGYFVASIASISYHALVIDCIISLLTGICFLALVVHDDAEKLGICHGRIIFALALACSSRGLMSSYVTIGNVFVNSLYIFGVSGMFFGRL